MVRIFIFFEDCNDVVSLQSQPKPLFTDNFDIIHLSI